MLTIVSVVAFVAFADPAQRVQPPSKEELAAITARGRELAEYDAAAWRASDAVQALKPREGSIQQYIAKKTDRGWVVSFGRQDPKEGRFLAHYEATQKPGKPEEFEVKERNPLQGGDAFLQAASRSIDATLKDFVKNFQGEPRPYNVAVLPAEMGRLWVYLMPAQTKVGVWPLGGDFRYLISADGGEIVAKRQLHKTILENEPLKDKDKAQVVGMHSHVLDDSPEDTDVFHVLVRNPAVPELVVTNQFVFQVDPDGSISYKGKSEGRPKE